MEEVWLHIRHTILVIGNLVLNHNVTHKFQCVKSLLDLIRSVHAAVELIVPYAVLSSSLYQKLKKKTILGLHNIGVIIELFYHF